ncbi:unnamed protein product [Rangifer tarandus platyrhynchus]|uniref:C2H2-type domain-containing protein n=1 Tax=Rangifer tarandus platyrhynchus TaxID=3082113 RepID=A0ABN8XMU5_RANTA|nr:unnamed protein product [Rangifer tarandus platyrhynchus]
MRKYAESFVATYMYVSRHRETGTSVELFFIQTVYAGAKDRATRSGVYTSTHSTAARTAVNYSTTHKKRYLRIRLVACDPLFRRDPRRAFLARVPRAARWLRLCRRARNVSETLAGAPLSLAACVLRNSRANDGYFWPLACTRSCRGLRSCASCHCIRSCCCCCAAAAVLLLFQLVLPLPRLLLLPLMFVLAGAGPRVVVAVAAAAVAGDAASELANADTAAAASVAVTLSLFPALVLHSVDRSHAAGRALLLGKDAALCVLHRILLKVVSPSRAAGAKTIRKVGAQVIVVPPDGASQRRLPRTGAAEFLHVEGITPVGHFLIQDIVRLHAPGCEHERQSTAQKRFRGLKLFYLLVLEYRHMCLACGTRLAARTSGVRIIYFKHSWYHGYQDQPPPSESPAAAGGVEPVSVHADVDSFAHAEALWRLYENALTGVLRMVCGVRASESSHSDTFPTSLRLETPSKRRHWDGMRRSHVLAHALGHLFRVPARGKGRAAGMRVFRVFPV